ncbi:MAG: VIT1/CCC1 transporter family protein [Opitutaceae bacterium]|nr:VIT1/CCC1 transporter family protein [Cytophagales bacterium]
MHGHKEEHFTSSETVRDVVIGMSDGLTVPFALAAGLSGAVDSNTIIITAGIAEVVAGSIAMGLGGYLAGKTQVEHYEGEYERERREVEIVPDFERQEVLDVFLEMGLSKDSSEAATEEIIKDKNKWIEFMMKFELGLEKPDPNRASKSGFTIATAYVVGGIIPLSGYYFTNTPLDGLLISSAITLICLFLFGYYKSKLTGQPPLIGAFRVLFIGALASSAAYIIARWIQS